MGWCLFIAFYGVLNDLDFKFKQEGVEYPMKNKFTTNGDTTVVHCQYKGDPVDILISTSDLARVQEIPSTIHIKAKKGVPKYGMFDVWLGNGKSTKIYLHRWIMQPDTDLPIDHKDRNGLNNTRDNLRIVTTGINNQNTGLRTDNKSGYKGVCWDKDRDKWSACIYLSGKKKLLGRFDNIEDAIKARQEAEKEYYNLPI